MKFHEYATLYNKLNGRAERNGPRLSKEEFSKQVRAMYEYGIAIGVCKEDETSVKERVEVERVWMIHNRPYYSVFPVVNRSLIRTPLDLDCSLMKLPTEALLVRFAEGQEPFHCRNKPVKSFLASFPSSPIGKLAYLSIDDGNESEEEGDDPKSCISFGLKRGITVEESMNQIDDWRHASDDFKKMANQLVRTLFTLCLLANDPSVIQPEVLADDQIAFEKTRDQKYVERARRRGKVGWLVGADWETCPHYRRPHFALRWTGEGGAVPKIVPIKGAIVHRTKLSDVPMGYLDDETSPQE